MNDILFSAEDQAATDAAIERTKQNPLPLRDSRTYSAAIADLDDRMRLLTSVVEAIARENIDLRARVAALETRYHDTVLDINDHEARVTALEARWTKDLRDLAATLNNLPNLGSAWAIHLTKLPPTDPATVTWSDAISVKENSVVYNLQSDIEEEEEQI